MNDSFAVEKFVRSDLQTMAEYRPGKTLQMLSAEIGIPVEQMIKLDANENPYGPSPQVYEALSRCRQYHLYPPADQNELRQALADYVGMEAEHILAGSGSDEIIDLIWRLFLNPGDLVINCPPTFGMYAFEATLHRGRVVDIPRRADFSLDIPEIESRFRSGALDGAKLLLIASPNNPDGSQTSFEDVVRLLQLPVILVVDEAYVEFSGESLATWVPRYPNLIVTRTFSKLLGLAGLRIGYGIFPLPIIRHVWKVKPPFNVNIAAQVAALASLEDLPYLEAQKKRLLAERQRLYEALQRFSFLQVYPSRANFILVRVKGRPARAVQEGLERRGILVRHYFDPQLSDCLRITVGRPEQTDALLAAMQAIEKEGGSA